MNDGDQHALAGAYALHSLPEEERAAFEEHLALCTECRQEVAEFAATAGRLALAVATTPPPALKQAVLQRIGTVRQEPPRTPVKSHPVHATPRVQRLRRFVLAACVAAAALGGVAIWQNQEVRQAREQAGQAQSSAEQIASVLAAGDARTHTAALPDGARGVVVTSAAQNRAVFTASGLETPPEGKVYQLWFDDDGTMRSAGLLDQRQSNQITLAQGALNSATGMGITLEPTGGSRTPTLPPVGLIAFRT